MLTATWTNCLQRHELISCMSEFSLYTSGTTEELKKRFASYIVDHWHDKARMKRLMEMQKRYCQTETKPTETAPADAKEQPTAELTSRPTRTEAQRTPGKCNVEQPPHPTKPQATPANTGVKPPPRPTSSESKSKPANSNTKPPPRPNRSESKPKPANRNTKPPPRPTRTEAQPTPANPNMGPSPHPTRTELKPTPAKPNMGPPPLPTKTEAKSKLDNKDTKSPQAGCTSSRTDLHTSNYPKPVKKLRADAKHIFADITIGGVAATAILDTGSTRSFVNDDMVQRLGLPIIQTAEVVEITMADGTIVEVDEVVEADVSLGNIRCKLQFIIMPNDEEVLLGLDFCIRAGLAFSCGGETIQLGTPRPSGNLVQVSEMLGKDLEEFKKIHEKFLGEIDDETLREVREVVCELAESREPRQRKSYHRIIRGQHFKFQVMRTDGFVRPSRYEPPKEM